MVAGDRVRDRKGEGGGEMIEKREMQMQSDLRGKDFHHPYTPYKIQEEFMKTVYSVLEGGGGRVGILESPTGTVGGIFLFIAFGFLRWFVFWDGLERESRMSKGEFYFWISRDTSRGDCRCGCGAYLGFEGFNLLIWDKSDAVNG